MSPSRHAALLGLAQEPPSNSRLATRHLATHASDSRAHAAPTDAEARALEAQLARGEWAERTTGDGKKLRGRAKKRDRQAAVSAHETTWVGCDKCGKWRKLPAGVALPNEAASARWTCKQNKWDPARNKCSAPEEPWS